MHNNNNRLFNSGYIPECKVLPLFYSVDYTEQMHQWSCRNSFYEHIKVAFGTFVFLFHGGRIAIDSHSDPEIKAKKTYLNIRRHDSCCTNHFLKLMLTIFTNKQLALCQQIANYTYSAGASEL